MVVDCLLFLSQSKVYKPHFIRDIKYVALMTSLIKIYIVQLGFASNLQAFKRTSRSE